MPNLKTELSEYWDDLFGQSQPVDVDALIAATPKGAASDEIIMTRLAETDARLGEPDDDLAVDYIWDQGQSEAPDVQKQRMRVFAAAAATILVVLGIAVVAGGQRTNLVTDPIASGSTADPVAPGSTLQSVAPASGVDSVPSGDQSRAVAEGQEVRQELASVIVAGPGLVAVGSSSTGSFTFPVLTHDDAAVWTSVDGTTWSRAPHDPTVFGQIRRQEMTSVAVGGPGLVAVGRMHQTDDFQNPGIAGVVWTSADGITWSLVPHDETIFGGPGNQSLNSATAGGPGLVAVGQDGGGNNVSVDAAVWISVDGSIWSRVPHDEAVFGGAAMHSVVGGGPGLVAVGSSGVGGDNLDFRKATEADKNFTPDAVVWTSVDGITWSRLPDDEEVFGGLGDQTMNKVIAGGPGLVAVGDAGSDTDTTADAAVWTSVDGLTWSRVPHDEAVFGGGAQNEMNSVVVGGPGLVAVGREWFRDASSNAAVWTSVDGQIWTRVAASEEVFGGAGSQTMTEVTSTGQGLVAVGRDGTGGWNKAGNVDAAIWASIDGITWSRVALEEAGS